MLKYILIYGDHINKLFCQIDIIKYQESWSRRFAPIKNVKNETQIFNL